MRGVAHLTCVHEHVCLHTCTVTALAYVQTLNCCIGIRGKLQGDLGHNMQRLFLMQLVEMWLHLSPAMSAIYDAISDLMDSCVKELRKSNKIDTSQLTLEHGLFKSFDDIVRRQLDSVWHTVSPKTKQVSWIKLLHDLLSLVDATSIEV